MNDSSKITVLGCGTSTGVPVISCNCEVCTSENPKNNRTRSSLFIESPTTKLLIDTGPDLRQQLLREKISAADAVLFTHGHADHTVGFDEIRAFCWRRENRLPIYACQDTLEILDRMFPWAFDQKLNYQGYVRAEGIAYTAPFTIGDLSVTPFLVEHGSVPTHGFRITLPSQKTFIYAPDVKNVPSDSLSHLENADLHILDGLRYKTHPTHMSVSEACELADQVSSPLTFLTHLSHEVNYESESADLPPNRHFAYDGMTFQL